MLSVIHIRDQWGYCAFCLGRKAFFEALSVLVIQQQGCKKTLSAFLCHVEFKMFSVETVYDTQVCLTCLQKRTDICLALWHHFNICQNTEADNWGAVKTARVKLKDPSRGLELQVHCCLLVVSWLPDEIGWWSRQHWQPAAANPLMPSRRVRPRGCTADPLEEGRTRTEWKVTGFRDKGCHGIWTDLYIKLTQKAFFYSGRMTFVSHWFNLRENSLLSQFQWSAFA